MALILYEAFRYHIERSHTSQSKIAHQAKFSLQQHRNISSSFFPDSSGCTQKISQESNFNFHYCNLKENQGVSKVTTLRVSLGPKHLLVVKATMAKATIFIPDRQSSTYKPGNFLKNYYNKFSENNKSQFSPHHVK